MCSKSLWLYMYLKKDTNQSLTAIDANIIPKYYHFYVYIHVHVVSAPVHGYQPARGSLSSSTNLQHPA
jgi:hypothetical protein